MPAICSAQHLNMALLQMVHDRTDLVGHFV